MDCFYYIPMKAALPALVIMLAAPAVMAGAITNLSDTVHVVEIQTSSGTIAHEILPGRTFRVAGRVKLKFNQKEFYLDDDMEYAIWRDGAFGPQRKNKHNRSR